MNAIHRIRLLWFLARSGFIPCYAPHPNTIALRSLYWKTQRKIEGLNYKKKAQIQKAHALLDQESSGQTSSNRQNNLQNLPMPLMQTHSVYYYITFTTYNKLTVLKVSSVHNIWLNVFIWLKLVFLSKTKKETKMITAIKFTSEDLVELQVNYKSHPFKLSCLKFYRKTYCFQANSSNYCGKWYAKWDLMFSWR